MPTVSIERLLNVATPFEAVTPTDPLRLPGPALFPMAIVTVLEVPTVVPALSSIVTFTDGIVEFAVVFTGWTEKTSWVAGPALAGPALSAATDVGSRASTSTAPPRTPATRRRVLPCMAHPL